MVARGMDGHFPVDEAVPALIAALGDGGCAVLQAPTGSGKTTRLPLALLDWGGIDGRILMLEPRRVAARAAAERMASSLGEAVGGRVGYRMRGEAKLSRETRIEVLTEGILTRMLQHDPALAGVGCVIFDEFHERSLNADLGLALCMEMRGALRPDLKLLVMSATLDAGPVAEVLDAPLITAEGRSFEVEVIHKPAPAVRGRAPRLEGVVAGAVRAILEESAGGVLVFLPAAFGPAGGCGDVTAIRRAALWRTAPRAGAGEGAQAGAGECDCRNLGHDSGYLGCGRCGVGATVAL